MKWVHEWNETLMRNGGSISVRNSLWNELERFIEEWELKMIQTDPF